MLIPVNEWGSIVTSVADGTQPNTSWGTAITPGTSNSYGSYTSVLAGASLTSDAYMIDVLISETFTLGTDRGVFVTIGFDPAGGTSFGGLGGVTGNEINDLMCHSQNIWYAGGVPLGGIRYRFPLYIKSGTSIGAKAQASNGAAGNCRVAVVCYCQPSRPDAVRAGAFVRSFGLNTGTTAGTSVTQGTASEGSWTEIGTAADTLWWLQGSVCARDAAQVSALSHSDFSVGDGSNKRTVLRDYYLLSMTDETVLSRDTLGAFVNIASGDKIYGRSQATAAQSGFQMAAYAVGG